MNYSTSIHLRVDDRVIWQAVDDKCRLTFLPNYQYQLAWAYLPPGEGLQICVPNMCHSVTGESTNKVRVDVWVELGLEFKRFADNADAQAEEGRREPDGSFSVNRRGDLEYFFYCPHCPICLCHSKTQMCECKRGVHFEEHFGGKRNHVMITSIRFSTSTRYSLTVREESSIYMLNILPLIKGLRVAFYINKSLLN